MTSVPRAHLITGGYPPGAPAGHDMDYARLRLLELLREGGLRATVANDFGELERWLPGARLLVTYVAGPYADEDQNAVLGQWLAGGGRWLALHGSSGGRAERLEGRRRRMVRSAHHETLGCRFLNHPPLRRIRVQVADRDHLLTRGLPSDFEVDDELYLIELLDPRLCHVLLTTDLPEDPSPPGFGFVYEKDTSLQPDGRTRVLGYTKGIGAGAVAYVALGHCHDGASNVQPFVDASVSADGATPERFTGPWETECFLRLLRNGIAWGAGDAEATN
jgi:uncharacterized protein